MSRQWLPARGDLPGIALAVAVAGASLAVARILPPSPFVSDILIALVAGALVVNTPIRRLVGLSPIGHEREADRFSPGLRYVGKWVLRLAIVFMGLKVRTELFRAGNVALMAGAVAASLPSAFFVAHFMGARLGLRRPLADLLAGGTMICGASAVNALAPAVGARREEQGVATAVVFLFSVVALLAFRPVAQWVHLDSAYAGLWSGLAVNDLSSAVAVGRQMGGDGAVLATASKSARILLLAPLLLVMTFARAPARRHAAGLGRRALETLPFYLIGYVALAIVRALGDRLWPGSTWRALLDVDRVAVDLLLLAVAAAIGLHLDKRTVVSSGVRALLAGGVASLVMASLTLAIIVPVARGTPATGALVGILGVIGTFAAFRLGAAGQVAARVLETRFAAGLPLSLAEATELLDRREAAGEPIDDGLARRVLSQLYPSIGELIPARESPLRHGEGSRWTTYWQGSSGWALVAVCRDPGSATPIHAHPHRLLAKTIEGLVEELRFAEEPGAVVLLDRRVPPHDELVDTDGLRTIHLVRNVGPRLAIDLQLRGPEEGPPGRRFVPAGALDLARLAPGDRVSAVQVVDDRPGHGGEGAAAGRPARA